MPRGASRDLAVTRLLRENKIFLDHRSFVSLPSVEDGKPHLYLFGDDKVRQCQKVYERDAHMCQAGKPQHFINEYIFGEDYRAISKGEVDHKKGGNVGRCDCLHNLRQVCGAWHRWKHNQGPEPPNHKGKDA